MKYKLVTLVLVLAGIVSGSVFAVFRSGSRLRLPSESNCWPEGENKNPASQLADFGDTPPTLERTIRLAHFVGEVKILALKRRGFGQYSVDQKQFLVNETDSAIMGDYVNLKPEDIRRDDLVTEYESEVVSALAGELKPGDRITLRIAGFAQPQAQTKAYADSEHGGARMEVMSDQFLYLLHKTPDGAYVASNSYRMKRENDVLLRTYVNNFDDRKEAIDYVTGCVITQDVLETAIKDNFGKPLEKIVDVRATYEAAGIPVPGAAPTAKPIGPPSKILEAP